jgi:hypothetical protein
MSGKQFQIAKGKVQMANETAKQNSRSKTNQKAKTKNEKRANPAARTPICRSTDD